MVEKLLNQRSFYGLSKKEKLLLEVINSSVTFSYDDLQRICPINNLHNTLKQMKKKGIISTVKKGVYYLTESENIYEIVSESFSPCYISFWTALSYYGFTEQQIFSVQIVTTNDEKTRKVSKYKIIPIKFKPERFFGYLKIDNFSIAEKEKALIDSLAFPEKAGGIKEVAKCLSNAWPELNKKSFIQYLSRFDNNSLNARVGYILEELQLKNINMPLPNTYVKLNKRNPNNGIYNKKWRLIVNDSL